MRIPSILALGLLAALPALADTPRIAVVDVKTVFDGFEGTRSAQGEYDRQVAAWEQQVADMQRDLARMRDEAERQSLMLSDERKRELEARFRRKQDSLQTFVQGLYGPQGRVVRRNEEFTRPILERIRVTVQQVARAEGYEMVFDRSGGSVFLWRDQDDITQKVLDRMNAEAGSRPVAIPPVSDSTVPALPSPIPTLPPTH